MATQEDFTFFSEDIEKLIDLVRKFPELYLKEHKNYKDNTIRKNIWKRISSTLNIDVKECKLKWKNLRDGYRRNKRKLSSGSAAAASKYNGDNLKFLDGSFLERQTISSFPNTLENIPPEPPHDFSADSEEEKEEEIPKKRKLDHQRKTSKEKIIEELSKSRTERNKILSDLFSQENSDRNPVVGFFKNLGQTVSTFPPELIVETKRRVFDIVNEMEMKAVTVKSISPVNSDAPSPSPSLSTSTATANSFINWLM